MHLRYRVIALRAVQLPQFTEQISGLNMFGTESFFVKLQGLVIEIEALGTIATLIPRSRQLQHPAGAGGRIGWETGAFDDGLFGVRKVSVRQLDFGQRI